MVLEWREREHEYMDQRTVAYTVRHWKRLSRAKIKIFYMNLMFENGIVNRLKHGVGVEGEGA